MIKNMIIVKELYGFVILYELQLKKKDFNVIQSNSSIFLQQSMNNKTNLKKRSNMHYLSQVGVFIVIINKNNNNQY